MKGDNHDVIFAGWRKMGTPYKIRIFVRNKSRYNPETKERDFLFVDVTDFAETTIGDIKEVRKRALFTNLFVPIFLVPRLEVFRQRLLNHLGFFVFLVFGHVCACLVYAFDRERVNIKTENFNN